MPRPASALVPAWIDGTLQPLDKLDVHRRGLRHPAVSVFVNDGDFTLIQKRAAGKYHTPGLWANACCTHPHWGEPPEACAVRRLEQELGITGIGVQPRGAPVEYRADVGGGLVEHEVVHLFTVEADRARLPLAPAPAEVETTRWIALDDLRARIAATPEYFTPWLRIYLARHAGQVFGEEAQAP